MFGFQSVSDFLQFRRSGLGLRHVGLQVCFFLDPMAFFTVIFLSQLLELSVDIVILFLQVVLLLRDEPRLFLELVLHVPGLRLQFLLAGLALREVEFLALGLLRQLFLEVHDLLVDERLLLLVLALRLPESSDRPLGLSLDVLQLLLEGLLLPFEFSFEPVHLAVLAPQSRVSVDLLGLELVF